MQAPPDSQPAAPAADTDEAFAVQAATAREEIVAEDQDRQWHGVPLQPWSEGRSRLLDALCAADVPMPSLATCDPLTFVNGYFSRAVKVLYLLHHQPQHWEPLRSRLLSVIEEWGVEHVPAATLEDKMLAVSFARKVEKAHHALMAVQRPSGRARGGASGN